MWAFFLAGWLYVTFFFSMKSSFKKKRKRKEKKEKGCSIAQLAK
jgi:hypothetical protein